MSSSNDFILTYELNIPLLANQLGNVRLVDYANITTANYLTSIKKSDDWDIEVPCDMIDENTVNYMNEHTECFELTIKKKLFIFNNKFYCISDAFKTELQQIRQLCENVHLYTKARDLNNVNWNRLNYVMNIADYVILVDIMNNNIKSLHPFKSFMMLSNYYHQTLENMVNKSMSLLDTFDVNTFLYRNPDLFWELYLTIKHMIQTNKPITDYPIYQWDNGLVDDVYDEFTLQIM